jgi:solute carrier family 25 phosphate transporter 3
MIPTDLIVKLLATHHPLGGLGNQHQSHTGHPGNLKPRREPFPAWSVVDEVKKTAAHEYEAASQTAQNKAGKIELWTPKYYAACTFGGLLACVSDP